MLLLTSLSGIIVGSRVAKAELATANSLATFQNENQLSNFKLDLKKLSGSSWLAPGFGPRTPARKKCCPPSVGWASDELVGKLQLVPCIEGEAAVVDAREISGFAVLPVSSLDALSQLMICSLGARRI